MDDARLLYVEHQAIFASIKETILQLGHVQQSIQENKGKKKEELKTFVGLDLASSISGITASLEQQFKDSREKIAQCKVITVNLPPPCLPG